MSDALRIIYACDHSLNDPKTVAIEQTVTRTSDEFDLIGQNLFLKGIDEVFDENGYIVKTNSYALYTHNKIKWVGIDTPAVGNTYVVRATNYLSLNTQYSPDDCPRCRGFGWYAGFLDPKTSRAKSSTDSTKLVQDVIKMLLTKYDGTVGTELRNIIGSSYANKNTLKNDIMSCVSDAEDLCKKYQAQIVSEGGYLSEKETLSGISIINIETDSDTRSYAYVELSIISVAGTASYIGVEV